MVAVTLFGVYVFFVKLCDDNFWYSMSVKGQSITKNNEHVFSTLKKYIWSDVTNSLCLNMHHSKHQFTWLSHAFLLFKVLCCIVASLLPYSGGSYS